MRPAPSDTAFTLRIGLCAWAAWVPVLQFVADKGQGRPAVVIERICAVDDGSAGCSAPPSCGAGSRATDSPRADQPESGDVGESGDAGTQRARCCICFFVGDLAMITAPAVAPAVPPPSARAPLADAAVAASRDVSPPSPPPEQA